ncbi:MAG: PEGA domain-containing protein, partial [Kiritimatiellia bacterium]|nr:PEGA domain-containing protein [Kiritimatiellia bacterium]
MAAGCSSIAISSTPSGGRVYINEKDTGLVTPTDIHVRKFHTGTTYISVVKEGYIASPEKQAVQVKYSGGNIFWSWFPPVLIKNLLGDWWRGVVIPRDRMLEDFILKPSSSPAPDPTMAVAEMPIVPVVGVAEPPSPQPDPARPLAPVPEESAPAALTNSDVIQMLEAQLDEEVIVAMIRKGPCRFDTSPMAIIELKKQGVSAAIMNAMIRPEPDTPPSAVTPNPSANANPLLAAAAVASALVPDDFVYLVAGPNRTAMKYAMMSLGNNAKANIASSFIPYAPHKTYMTLNGAKSSCRIVMKNIGFEFRLRQDVHPDSQVSMIRFAVRERDRMIQR